MRQVLRQEKKFLIDTFTYLQNAHVFEQILIPDEHNGNDGYMVRSLYFDTLGDIDFHEKMDGVKNRKKIRLRVYDPHASVAYLEIKQKDGQYQSKRSLEMKREDALELINKNYDVLLKYDDDFARLCYSVMKSENYIPKTVVEYKRKAYIAKENNIRLTFDSDIVASEMNFNIFDDKLLLYPVFPKENVVFEVKYNGFLLSYIKDLINNINRSELSVSKYCLARQISLNYVF